LPLVVNKNANKMANKLMSDEKEFNKKKICKIQMKIIKIYSEEIFAEV
jgi:hypothetical protein